ncbi:MAG: hypothetical protein KMY53_12060 [Desulfarculus sp.]|nr:hypothetical protein [Pseudomonadota bacterium]MBV1738893.1 hypothetical protein [Desulfarculus sp.]
MPSLTFIAILVAIFKETIVSWVYKPKLEVNYKPETPYITFKLFEGIAAYYFNLQIINTKRKPCKECFVEISEIYIDEDGKYNKVPYFIPGSLKWLTTCDQKTDIYKGQKKYINIGFIIEKNWIEHRDYFETENAFIINFWDRSIDNGINYFGKKGDNVFLDDKNDNNVDYDEQKTVNRLSKSMTGKYRFVTTVYSTNSNPKEDYWEITWSGNFITSADKIQNEVVISQLVCG